MAKGLHKRERYWNILTSLSIDKKVKIFFLDKLFDWIKQELRQPWTKKKSLNTKMVLDRSVMRSISPQHPFLHKSLSGLKIKQQRHFLTLSTCLKVLTLEPPDLCRWPIAFLVACSNAENNCGFCCVVNVCRGQRSVCNNTGRQRPTEHPNKCQLSRCARLGLLVLVAHRQIHWVLYDLPCCVLWWLPGQMRSISTLVTQATTKIQIQAKFTRPTWRII